MDGPVEFAPRDSATATELHDQAAQLTGTGARRRGRPASSSKPKAKVSAQTRAKLQAAGRKGAAAAAAKRSGEPAPVAPPAPEPPADDGAAARVAMLTAAIHASGGLIVGTLKLDLPWETDASAALAQAWDPVLEQYAPTGPLGAALLTTGVVLAPYALRYLELRAKPKPADTPTTVAP